MRSMREIQQMGHFDPENIQPDIQPDPMNGTVDIAYNLVSKANDQVEFSAGWGQTGVIGKLSLKFTNFSLANLLHPGDNYRGILPQGDGQTLTVSGQTNADTINHTVSHSSIRGLEANVRTHSQFRLSTPDKPISVAAITTTAIIITITTVL